MASTYISLLFSLSSSTTLGYQLTPLGLNCEATLVKFHPGLISAEEDPGGEARREETSCRRRRHSADPAARGAVRSSSEAGWALFQTIFGFTL